MQTNAATINQSVDKIEKRNQTTTSERIRSYITHPGSGVLALLTVGAAIITFAVNSGLELNLNLNSISSPTDTTSPL